VPRPSTNDRGQATVEFALLLPLFVLLIVAVFDATAIVRDQLLVDLLARDAARHASQAESRDAAQQRVAEVVVAAGRSDARWNIEFSNETLTVKISLIPRASLTAISLRWLGASNGVMGTATFATEYDIDEG
jgi:Flp pilus assembly protein TadG